MDFPVPSWLNEQSLTALKALLATCCLLLAVLVSWLVARQLERALQRLHTARLQSLPAQGFPTMPAESIFRALKLLIRLVRWAFLALAGYIYLAFLFLLVPTTRFLAAYLQVGLANFAVRAGEAVLGYTPNFLTIIAAVMICRFVIRSIRLVMEAVGSRRMVLPGFDPDWASATSQLLRFLTLALTVVVVFPLLPGAASPAFQGISVFLGILLSLGSGGAISHVVSGVFLTYTNAFKVGDVIRLGELEGILIERSLLVARIRTFKNEEITIPNARVLEASITNYSVAARRHELILYTSITLGYDAPWQEVHQLLCRCVGLTEGLLKSPEPFVLQTSLDGAWVEYQINAYTELAERMPWIYSDLRGHIQDVFNEAGIELMTTHFHSVRDGNLSTIPSSYGKTDSKVGFRILPRSPKE